MFLCEFIFLLYLNSSENSSVLRENRIVLGLKKLSQKITLRSDKKTHLMKLDLNLQASCKREPVFETNVDHRKKNRLIHYFDRLKSGNERFAWCVDGGCAVFATLASGSVVALHPLLASPGGRTP